MKVTVTLHRGQGNPWWRHLLALVFNVCVTGGPVKVSVMLLTGTNARNDTLSKNIYDGGLSRWMKHASVMSTLHTLLTHGPPCLNF